MTQHPAIPESRLRGLTTTAIALLAGAFALGMLDLIPALLIGLGLFLLTRLLIRKNARSAAAGLTISFITLLGMVLVLEILIRLFWGNFLYFRPHEMLFIRWPGYAGAFRYDPDRRITMQAYGDLAAIEGVPAHRVSREVYFETDSRGFRNAQGTAGPFDVIVLGDSFAAGNGSSQEDIWARQLGSAFDLRVYNLGIPGSPWNSFANLTQEWTNLEMAPGGVLVLMLFPGNDLDEVYGTTPIGSPPDFLERLQIQMDNYQARSPVRRLVSRVGSVASSQPQITARVTSSGETFLFFDPYVSRSERTASEVAVQPHFPALIDVLAGVDRLADARGVRWVVVLMPSKEEVYSWLLKDSAPEADPSSHAWRTALEPHLNGMGVPILDLLPILREEAVRRYLQDGSLIWWPDDTHPNPAGHALIADLIADFLQR